MTYTRDRQSGEEYNDQWNLKEMKKHKNPMKAAKQKEELQEKSL